MFSATLDDVCGCMVFACHPIHSRTFFELRSFVSLHVCLCVLTYSYVSSYTRYFYLTITSSFERISWPCLRRSCLAYSLIFTCLFVCMFALIYILLLVNRAAAFFAFDYSLIID